MKRSRSLSGRDKPRAREPNMKSPVAPFSWRAASYVLTTSISAAWFIGSDNGTVRPKLDLPPQFVAVGPHRIGRAESDQIQHDESHLTY